MTHVEQFTFFPQEVPGLDSNTEQSKALIQNALQANKQLQQSLIQRAEELEAKLKEADELLAAATIAESQDEPEPEIVIPGAKKAASIFPLTDFSNPMSPFHEEATKRSSYVTNTAPHSFKAKDIEVLSAAVRQENERLQAYNRLQDPASDTWQSIDLERNTEGLDWPRIAEKVSDASSVKRTAIDCQIVWKADKHPAVNHAGWSEDELNKLNLLVSQYTKENTTLDWLKIAEKLGTSRVPIDCMRHGMLRTRHTWSPEMDEKLVGAVQSCGQDNWQLIARKVSEDVSAGQCQYRWQKALNPELRKGTWTEDEDNRLRKAVAGYGSSWIQVAETIPGRTNDQCRDRWTSHLNKTPAAKATWTKEEDKALLALVKECGKHWKNISLKIGTTKNGQSCRLRYAKLMKTNVEGVLSTSFIMSALSQPDEEQRAVSSSNDGPTLISHREVRRIAPRLLPTIKVPAPRFRWKLARKMPSPIKLGQYLPQMPKCQFLKCLPEQREEHLKMHGMLLTPRTVISNL
ncbi:hypothetical protein BDN70DRAFT_639030 [Pholiota conissans]|uniref:Uncharacterized protein n=1 Tax=Pholiota conissans TaxID=109636 RepID=A0A9P6CYL7_9AGAR|nr:hypothetical protein BDN70DRAFT_639030 [Pholiota conissans]